jgi:hypothetical protein
VDLTCGDSLPTAVERKCNLLGKQSVYVNPTGNKVSAQDLRHLVGLCNGKVGPLSYILLEFVRLLI